MIDTHSHILPQMDDGSASPEETAALLDLLWQQKVSTVVATPHFYATRETPDAFLKRRQEAVERMLPVTESQPQVLLGAEVTYFAGVSCCEEIIPLQIENTKLLLIEMPYSAWTERMITEICQIPERLGLIPVLAHVNRYLSKNQFLKHRKTLAENGVLFQCNGDAFTRLRYRHWALRMLKKGYIHFIGSDCHGLENRAPLLDQTRRIIEKKLGADFLRTMNDSVCKMLFPG